MKTPASPTRPTGNFSADAVFVVAVIATHRRAMELERLLCSLAAIPKGLGAILVVDNDANPAIAALTARFPKTTYLNPGSNLGCGGGLNFGETKALELFGDRLTHLWILDDDVVLPPGILEDLLAAMEECSADAACPMVKDANDALGWFPGLLDRTKFRAIKMCKTQAQFLERCGSEPVAFDWAQGISLLISRRGFELGPHRTDYWVRGEDLEFSLRITHRYRGVFVPTTSVQHLPPPVAAQDELLKHAAMLQNICYTSLRLVHGRRIARTIPGNFLRFLRTWGLAALPSAWRAFYLGAIKGRPAGL